ncbi:hypothetical protein C2I06_18465 [Niallia circulans]|uniref:PRD domain-containing protein n=1 Tax=Niallia circulans TaxID=1397 RepID=UPI000F45CB36|nr:PRD domain-containing protein [Niallia circulans]AYV68705.1 hypothetical protein C2I06_18465 [Niallia circulans]
MKIVSILNNNALLVEEQKGVEFIVIGKGIGFGKKNGDLVDKSKVDKIFESNNKKTNELLDLLEYVPTEFFESVTIIVRHANKKLGKELNKGIYVTLTDHIHSAIERYKEGKTLNFALVSEMHQLYPNEYKVSEWAVDYLNATYDIELPIDEVGFITVHIIAATMDNDNLSLVKKVTKIVKNITDIVVDHYGSDINKDSINYTRFLTHLKFFAIRFLSKEQFREQSDINFVINEEGLKETSLVIHKIDDFMKVSYGNELTVYEKKYLILHLLRLNIK